ncbi:MAG: superfamily [Gemmatimonadetes bacterium]|nr:superfamily [Gemmatimonadota bacterium]
MTEPTSPYDPPQLPDDPPPPDAERRTRARGRASMLKGLAHKGLRMAAAHATNFYATVGIVLIVGTVLALAGTLAFAELGESVQKGATQAYDVAVLQWLGRHQTRLLTAGAVELTYLGTGTVVLMVVGVSALFLWHTEHKHSARILLVAVAGNILLNGMLKLVFHRTRPSVFDWQTTAVSSSFPSGHAMSATVCYGTVAYLVARLQKHRSSRVATLTGAVILILLICATRLYLGVHYPSDVIAGIVVGLAWSGFCMAVFEASLVLARRRAPEESAEERPAPVESATA